MAGTKTVEQYLASQAKWAPQLARLRKVLLDTELEETLKWGAPCYCLEGKNVIGLLGFTDYFGLWFHQGVFLKDPGGVLINAQEGTTKALRQWRMTSGEDLDLEQVLVYVLEAIENQKRGLKVEPTRSVALAIPGELQAALDSEMGAGTAWTQLTPGRQREYAKYVAEAKREATRVARAAKSLPLIMAGGGLHDRYRP